MGKRVPDLLQVDKGSCRNLVARMVNRVDQDFATVAGHDQSPLVLKRRIGKRPFAVFLAKALDHLANLLGLPVLLNQVASQDSLTGVRVRIQARSLRNARDDPVARLRADAPRGHAR
jgi:hypothetical protein